jgi:hypothetical protein
MLTPNRLAIPQRGFDAASVALFKRMATPPSTRRKNQIDALISTMKQCGVWEKLDAFYMLAAVDAPTALLNWKQNAFNLTATNSPTFTADQGYTGNGSNAYLESGFTPSTAGGNFALNNAHLGVYIRSPNAQGAAVIGSRTTSGTNQTFITPRSATDVAGFRFNQDVNGDSPASTDSTGHFVSRRTAASGVNATFMWRGETNIGGSTSASTALPTASFIILGQNTGGTPAATGVYQVSCAHWGSHYLYEAQTAFTNAIRAYLRAVGAI